MLFGYTQVKGKIYQEQESNATDSIQSAVENATVDILVRSYFCNN